MKARIVFFIQNFSRAGGSERAVSLIANELINRGYGVSILSICGDNTCFFNLNSDIKLYTLYNEKEVNNRRYFLKILRRLDEFYSKHSFDICIDVFASLSMYTLIIKKHYRLKNITWEHYNYLNNMGLNRIGRQLAIRFSNMIVTLTETDKKYYLDANNRLDCSKIEAIFNATPFPRTECVMKHDKSILSVGRLEKLKGFDQLIDVWSKICKKYPEWTLKIIGEGEERNHLQKLIEDKQIRNAELLGKRNDVDRYYKAAAIYVSTSEREGLPMTMIEAQSFGVPIVTYDYETGPKDIITDGEDGFIIKQGQNRNEEMAKRLSQLIDNPNLLMNMSNSAKKNSERFDVGNVVDRWEAVFKKLL